MSRFITDYNPLQDLVELFSGNTNSAEFRYVYLAGFLACNSHLKAGCCTGSSMYVCSVVSKTRHHYRQPWVNFGQILHGLNRGKL